MSLFTVIRLSGLSVQSIVPLAIVVLNNLIIIALGYPIVLARWFDTDELFNFMFVFLRYLSNFFFHVYPSIFQLKFVIYYGHTSIFGVNIRQSYHKQPFLLS